MSMGEMMQGNRALAAYRVRHALPPSVQAGDGSLRILAAGSIRMTLLPGPNGAVILRARIGALPRDNAERLRVVSRVGNVAGTMMTVFPAGCIVDTGGYLLSLQQVILPDADAATFDEDVALFAQACGAWGEILPTL